VRNTVNYGYPEKDRPRNGKYSVNPQRFSPNNLGLLNKNRFNANDCGDSEGGNSEPVNQERGSQYADK
jgi:hypothetical protein